MTKRTIYGGAAGASLALVIMPAAACPRQAAATVSPQVDRVHVIATADGFAITTAKDGPAAPRAPRLVPLGVQMQIDRDAFECSTRRFASARP